MRNFIKVDSSLQAKSKVSNNPQQLENETGINNPQAYQNKQQDFKIGDLPQQLLVKTTEKSISKFLKNQETKYAFEVNQNNHQHKKYNNQWAFVSNKISTTKYTWWNFIPKNLFYQFSRLQNIFYIIILALQVAKPVSISRGQPNIVLPLSIVVGMSAIKDIIEDVKRWLSDKSENKKKVLAVKGHNTFEAVKWENLRVGQIVKVNCDEYFPADLMFLGSSSQSGLCYVESKNLDGETNLKHKSTIKEIMRMCSSDSEVIKLKASVTCETPNDKIYQFQGVINLDSISSSQQQIEYSSKKQIYSLSEENLLLRGSSLKNTDYIYGLVVYTGHDTKIMRNSSHARIKLARNDKQNNIHSFLIFIFMITLAAFSAIYGVLIERAHATDHFSYLNIKLKGQQVWKIWLEQTFIRFGTWILMFANVIPISMIITVEVVRLVQGIFIQWDANIYDQEKDMSCKVQSSNLNEELGQVHHIFSDKTGTLTCNVMEFKKFSVGMHSYGLDGKDHKDSMRSMNPNELVTNVNFHDAKFYQHREKDDSNGNSENIELFVKSLALCHTIMVENRHGTTFYNASSPDELALVNAAKFLGVSFIGRDNDSNMIIKYKSGSTTEVVKLLNVIEFTSNRKRMSVIVQESSGKIMLICKGADSVISERLEKTDMQRQLLEKTDQYLADYATHGLRTLMLAYKEINHDTYNQWNEKYLEASYAITNRQFLIEQLADQIERDLKLLGSTAIEDLLQDQVSDTIKSLKEVGIVIWVLTGDKIETAINIGYSCELLNNDIYELIINQDHKLDIYSGINHAYDRLTISKCLNNYAVIVSGSALIKIIKNEEIKQKFLDLCNRAKIVLACRVSPKQKADLVSMVKTKFPNKVTLAIGDGANDVSMINAAHIGIGISGKEGQQAARASDYSIGQFKFLKDLLFVHGRECYRKNSYLCCYMFYKNVVFVLPQFWFGILNAFSGQTFYEQWVYQLYNMVFTSIPIAFYCVLDYEYTRQELKDNPQYYKIGFNNERFNRKVFWRWITYGSLQGLFITFLITHAFEKYSMNPEGQPATLWLIGMIIYSIVVIIVSIDIAFHMNNYNLFGIFAIAISIAAFYIVYGVMDKIVSVHSLFGTFSYIWESPQYYLCIAILVSTQLMYQTLVKNWTQLKDVFIRKRTVTKIYKKESEIELQTPHQQQRQSPLNTEVPTLLTPVKNKENSLCSPITPPSQENHRLSAMDMEVEPVQHQYSGFAFSQEPGQVPQLIDRLPSRDRYQHGLENHPGGMILQNPFKLEQKDHDEESVLDLMLLSNRDDLSEQKNNLNGEGS